MATRRTSQRVELCVNEYTRACDAAVSAARAALRSLCERVYRSRPLMDAALSCAALVEIGTACAEHARSAREKGWGLPRGGSGGSDEGDLVLRELTPYWLARGSDERTVANDVQLLRGQVAVLTGPNMAGKSTLLRAVAAAALLGACGLCAPLDGAASTTPHLSALLLRVALGDAPLHGKSAFAREMDDVALMMRECGPRSLVLVDELGRGTSAEEGAAIGAAVVAELLEREVRTVFATHLHESLKLLAKRRIGKREFFWSRALRVSMPPCSDD